MIFISSVFIIFLFIIILALNAFATYILLKNRSRQTLSFTNYVILTTLAFIFYYLSIFFFEESVMRVLYSLYLASMALSSLCLFRYVTIYTNLTIKKKLFWILLTILVIIDAGIQMVNIFYPLSASYIFNNYSNFSTIRPDGNVLFYIHLVLSYGLILSSLLLLIIKYKKSSSLYRFQYVYMIIFLLTIIIFNVFFITGVFEINVSTVIYCVFTFATTLYTYVYVPLYLENLTSTFMIEDIDYAFVLFDNKGNLISENYNSRKWFDIPSLMEIEKFNKTNNNEFNFKCKDGLTRLFVVSKNELKSKDKAHELIGIYFIARDVTLERMELARREYKANHDSLTGLYTENYFIELVQKKLINDNNTKYSIAIFEINHYNLCVNLFGTEVAKKLVKRFSEYLRNEIKDKTSIYGKYGDSKFLFFDTKDSIYKNCIDNRDRFNELVYENYEININIGVYDIDDTNEDVNKMIDKADLALVEIANLRNRSKIYNSSITERIIRENNLICLFSSALENDDIDIYVQPQINCLNGKLVGGEALVRWTNDGKMISPGEFLPLLIRQGLITKLDMHVWEKAIEFSKKLLDLGYPTPISINITAQDLFAIDINEYINSLLKKYDLPSKFLNIEITESEVMVDLSYTIDVINKFKSSGLKVEMDDFGSAYSSLNSLKNIPVDLIKLDLKFLNSDGDEFKKNVIISIMVELTKKLDIPLIAEGVEEKKQLIYLNKLGCRYIQGYYYSKPMKKDDFLEYRKNHGIDIIEKPSDFKD